MTDKNTKHTPGPWNISPLSLSGEDSGVYIYSGMLQIVDVLRRPDSTVTWANARLIAAAPELLEALLAVLPNTPGWNTRDFAGRSWLVAAEAAICKAKGEQL
jgi:hypothetical protein